MTPLHLSGLVDRHIAFLEALRRGGAPQMSLERAMDDHRLMDLIYAHPGR